MTPYRWSGENVNGGTLPAKLDTVALTSAAIVANRCLASRTSASIEFKLA
jgi:hypothetical protein